MTLAIIPFLIVLTGYMLDKSWLMLLGLAVGVIFLVLTLSELGEET